MRRLTILVVAGLIVVCLAGAVYGLLAAADLASARVNLKAAKTHTRAFEFPEARAALGRADDRLERARARLGAFPMRVLARVPVIGRNVRAVEAIARAATDAVGGARHALRAADALPSRAGLRVEDGQFPDIDWGAVGAASGDAFARFRAAEIRVRRTGGDLLGPIGRARTEFLGEIAEALVAARNLELGSRVMPDLLGEAGQRHHLIVIQNAAERRGTGGAIESFVLVRASEGRLRVVRSDPDEAVTGSPDDVDAAHRLNFEPDFTTVGLRIADAYAASTGVHADTVIALDQVAIGRLLAATGPVTVDGHNVSAENAVTFLSRDVLDAFAEEPGQSIFLGRLARALSARVLGGGFPLPDLVAQTARAAAGKHILVWARDLRAQEVVEAVGISGAAFFDRERDEPLVAAVIGNNPSPAEMDLYARRTVRFEVFLQRDGTADVSVRATLRNVVKRGELPGIVMRKSGFGRLRQEMTLWLGSDEPASVEKVRVDQGESESVTFPVEQVALTPGAFRLRILRQPGLFDDRLRVVVRLPPGSTLDASSGFGSGLIFEGLLDRDREFAVSWTLS